MEDLIEQLVNLEAMLIAANALRDFDLIDMAKLEIKNIIKGLGGRDMSKDLTKFSYKELLILKHGLQAQLREKRFLLEKANKNENFSEIQALEKDIKEESYLLDKLTKKVDEFRERNSIAQKYISRREEVKLFAINLENRLKEVDSLERG